MHVNRALLGWGVFFLVLGSVPLAVRYGLVDADAFDTAWQLWPLLLIGAGMGLVLARTRAAIVGGLVVAATAGLMVGGLVVNGVGGFGGGFASCGGGGGGTPFADQRGTLGTEAAVSLELDCGAGRGGERRRRRRGASAASRTTASRRWSRERDDRLTIESRARQGGIQLGGDGGNQWTVELPRDARTSLDLSVNAGSAIGDVRRHAARPGAGLGQRRERDARSRRRLEVGAFEASVNAGSLGGDAARGVDDRRPVGERRLARAVRPRWGRPPDPARGQCARLEQLRRGRDGAGRRTRGSSTATGRATMNITASANLGSITLNPDDGCA